MAPDTVESVLRPAVEALSGQRGEFRRSYLIDRILKLQATINDKTLITSIEDICTHSIHQDCESDHQATVIRCVKREHLQSGSMYLNIIGFTKRHLSLAVKKTGTLDG